jgi:hypothetical protein
MLSVFNARAEHEGRHSPTLLADEELAMESTPD